MLETTEMKIIPNDDALRLEWEALQTSPEYGRQVAGALMAASIPPLFDALNKIGQEAHVKMAANGLGESEYVVGIIAGLSSLFATCLMNATTHMLPSPCDADARKAVVAALNHMVMVRNQMDQKCTCGECKEPVKH